LSPHLETSKNIFFIDFNKTLFFFKFKFTYAFVNNTKCSATQFFAQFQLIKFDFPTWEYKNEKKKIWHFIIAHQFWGGNGGIWETELLISFCVIVDNDRYNKENSTMSTSSKQKHTPKKQQTNLAIDAEVGSVPHAFDFDIAAFAIARHTHRFPFVQQRQPITPLDLSNHVCQSTRSTEAYKRQTSEPQLTTDNTVKLLSPRKSLVLYLS
jgi:hypothetical protein